MTVTVTVVTKMVSGRCDEDEECGTPGVSGMVAMMKALDVCR